MIDQIISLTFICYFCYFSSRFRSKSHSIRSSSLTILSCTCYGFQWQWSIKSRLTSAHWNWTLTTILSKLTEVLVSNVCRLILTNQVSYVLHHKSNVWGSTPFIKGGGSLREFYINLTCFEFHLQNLSADKILACISKCPNKLLRYLNRFLTAVLHWVCNFSSYIYMSSQGPKDDNSKCSWKIYTNL